MKCQPKMTLVKLKSPVLYPEIYDLVSNKSKIVFKRRFKYRSANISIRCKPFLIKKNVKN